MKIGGASFLALVAGLTMVHFTLLSASGKGPANQKDADKKQLEKLELDWAAAVETNDPKKIGRFFTEDFLFVGAGGLLQNRQEHLEDFRIGKLKVKSVKIEEKVIHVYDGSAVVSSKVSVMGTFGERDISGPYQFTDTWVKQGSQWLAVARQQTAIAKPKAGGQ